MVMLNVGDLLDNTLGVAFGFSTLVAAGFGQMASDVSGVCFGGTVEALASKLGLPSSGMSSEQFNLRKTKMVTTFGMALGVLLGCVLGMSCLLFMDLDKAERLKREKELETIFETVIDQGQEQLEAEAATLYIVDPDKKELWSKTVSGPNQQDDIITLPVGKGLAGHVAATGQPLRIPDAYQDPRFDQASDAHTGFRTRSVLAYPVKECCADQEPRVIAVVQVLNKSGGGCFSEADERVLRIISQHVAIFMKHVGGEG
mmetsp:Transcript_36130/g.83853  ORF Transcript_36130/g.83853 Transcript_36130/m.83853 type:complete len:258 (-) Transcript_36130:134-907(-)